MDPDHYLINPTKPKTIFYKCIYVDKDGNPVDAILCGGANPEEARAKALRLMEKENYMFPQAVRVDVRYPPKPE